MDGTLLLLFQATMTVDVPFATKRVPLEHADLQAVTVTALVHPLFMHDLESHPLDVQLAAWLSIVMPELQRSRRLIAG